MFLKVLNTSLQCYCNIWNIILLTVFRQFEDKFMWNCFCRILCLKRRSSDIIEKFGQNLLPPDTILATRVLFCQPICICFYLYELFKQLSGIPLANAFMLFHISVLIVLKTTSNGCCVGKHNSLPHFTK